MARPPFLCAITRCLELASASQTTLSPMEPGKRGFEGIETSVPPRSRLTFRAY